MVNMQCYFHIQKILHLSCSTELSRTAALKSEFDKRNTKVMGLSVDSVGDHAMWETDIGDVARTL